MRVMILIAASATLLASGPALSAHHRGHVYYRPGPFGAYASAYGSRNLNACWLDPREETYIRVQDRFYQESQGRAC